VEGLCEEPIKPSQVQSNPLALSHGTFIFGPKKRFKSFVSLLCWNKKIQLRRIGEWRIKRIWGNGEESHEKLELGRCGKTTTSTWNEGGWSLSSEVTPRSGIPREDSGRKPCSMCTAMQWAPAPKVSEEKKVRNFLGWERQTSSFSDCIIFFKKKRLGWKLKRLLNCARGSYNLTFILLPETPHGNIFHHFDHSCSGLNQLEKLELGTGATQQCFYLCLWISRLGWTVGKIRYWIRCWAEYSISIVWEREEQCFGFLHWF